MIKSRCSLFIDVESITLCEEKPFSDSLSIKAIFMFKEEVQYSFPCECFTVNFQCVQHHSTSRTHKLALAHSLPCEAWAWLNVKHSADFILLLAQTVTVKSRDFVLRATSHKS